MDIKETFAANLRRQRKAAGLSQEKLAEIAGVHRTYIGGIEQKRVNVSLKNIERISKALDIDPATLFINDSDADDMSAWEDAARSTGELAERARSIPEGSVALAIWTDAGIEFHRIETAHEDLTIQVLVSLIKQGYSGTELAQQYKVAVDEIIRFLEEA